MDLGNTEDFLNPVAIAAKMNDSVRMTDPDRMLLQVEQFIKSHKGTKAAGLIKKGKQARLARSAK